MQVFARYATACLNRREKKDKRQLQTAVRQITAGAQATGALSSSQLSEMQDRLDSLEMQVEDERTRANALERQVDSERARADAMGRQVAGMGAMMEHVAAERGGSSPVV